ncbi:hypothetical protein GGR21_002909 [Dysgonomonas hofstadii]|uniref:Uncharacterized protein n=1 Tax=Dysgonomonas hofstadii TaxID=637886 RepID=A0A840CW08_9BACT|nr:hypothetical protein [Dysgonomonas hofstadii]MBB4036995.1 hypothetical protein [Dysgonomonas hofstadii]
MADYDNGLPPGDISIEDVSLSNVIVDSIEITDNETADHLSEIKISTSDMTSIGKIETANIILIDSTAKPGSNFAIFL